MARATTKPPIDAPRRPTVPDRYVPLVPARTAWFRQPPPFNGEPLTPMAQLDSGASPAPNLAFYHDGAAASVAVEAAGEGLALRTEGFAGSYLSLVFNLGEAVAQRIRKHDILRAAGVISVTEARPIFIRLNLVSGPSKLTLPMQIDVTDGPWMVEWDIFYTEFDPSRGKDVWIDMICDRPGTVGITLADFYLLRHPRANL